MADQELWKEIHKEYPNLSPTIAKVMTRSVFSRLAELEFPLDGDDDTYADWFMNVYTPAVKREEQISLDNYLY